MANKGNPKAVVVLVMVLGMALATTLYPSKQCQTRL